MIREATVDDLKPLAALYKDLMIYHNKFDPKEYKIPDNAASEKRIRYYLENDDERVPKIICHDTNGMVDGYAVYAVCNSYLGDKKIIGALAVEQIMVAENAQQKG